MTRLLKHKFLVGLAAALVLASGGAAYAATQTGANSRQSFLNDVAKRLNVSPSKLRAAVQGAMLDRLQAAVKAGELTQAQANLLKQRIENGGFPFRRLAGGGFWLHGPGARAQVVPRAGLMPLFGPLAAAAKYIGVSRAQLLSDLRGGKTLAQVAQSHGKSVSGLEQAIVAAQKSRLNHAVTLGYLTKAQEQRALSLLTRGIADLVVHARVMAPPWGKPPHQTPWNHPGIPPGLFGGGPAGPPAGGPAGAVPPAGGPKATAVPAP